MKETIGLKPYPTMKYSGVPWLGDVPEHWNVRRLRAVAEMHVSNVDKHSKEDEEPVRLCNYVDVYKNDRIRTKMTFMRATATRDEINRFRIQVGDVLITKDSETWNDIGVPALVMESAPDLVCGYHLALLRPFSGRVVSDYLFRALQSTGVAYQFHVEANGVTRYGLTHSGIKSIWLPTPPVHDQRAIARFVDYMDGRIRRYVRAEQKLIKLLKEQKQAIIHFAVTRGLDPNVRLKPSGVEWLGGVPEHWEVCQIRSIAEVVRGSSPRPAGSPLYFHGTAVPWITVGEITKDSMVYLTATSTQLTPAGAESSRIIESGTLLLTNSGATLGIPKISKIRGCINDGIAAFLKLRPRINKEFLFFFWLTQTVHLKAWVDLGAQPNLNTQIIGSWQVAIPSTIEEQNRIVEFIKRNTEVLTDAIERARRKIVLIHEYRTRLINDLVTGKLDVREAVAHLPEDIEEPEPIDDAAVEDSFDEEATDDIDEALEPIEV